MKKKKKLKIKKCVTSFLMLVAMAVSIVCVLPKSVTYADETLGLPEYDFRYNNLENKDYFDLFKWDNSCIGDTVSFWNAEKQSFSTAIISTSPLKASYTEYEFRGKYGGGSELSSKRLYTTHSGHFEASGKTYYYVWYSMTTAGGHIGYQVKKGICFGSKDFDADKAEKYIHEYILKTLPTSFVVIGGEGVDTNEILGSQDNPQNDEDIGYLVLKTTNTNTQTDLDALKNGIQSVHYNLDWKNKTSTGFSLSKNKYARTFIQFEVESQYVVYSDAKHTKIKHKFDNYGERGWIAKNWDATSKPFSLTTDQVNAALPKSTNEVLTQFDQNKIYQTGFTNGNIAINPLAFNFKIRYRVVCTNDITVIPDSSGGWHAGPWASTIIAGDEINDTSSHKSNHEGYGDDKNDNGESDDINHTKTDYDDNQDAKDHINDTDGKKNLDLDSAKEFINQVADVPKMIGALFSFFPDWVRYTVELGFAFIFILIVYKLIRG